MSGVPYKKWGDGHRQVIRFCPDDDSKLQIKDAGNGAIELDLSAVNDLLSNILSFMDKHVQVEWGGDS